MKIQVETISPVERKVTIEVDPARVAKEMERSYTGLGRRVKLRGFRPGKAPRKVLERHFRSEVESEVAEKIVQQTFAEAVRVESIDIVAPPQVSISEGVAEGKPLKYTARVEVKPRLDPKDYRGLAVTRKPPEVTDEAVSAELTRIQEQRSTFVAVEGRFEAQEGDYAVVDHEGTVDGEPFEGSQAQGTIVKVGPGRMVEGNIGALAGKKIGETIELEETFPEGYRNQPVAGKTARVKVTLQALKARELPSLDDAFVKGLGAEGIETLEQLRARIRTELEKREQRRAENEFKDGLIKAALAKNEFEVPPSLVERAVDNMIDGAAERFARTGIDISQLGMDYGRLRADLRDQALLQVRGRLLLEAIADAEKLEVTDEDLQAEIARLADEMGLSLAQAQQQMKGGETRAALRNKLREDKALALMTSSATITNA